MDPNDPFYPHYSYDTQNSSDFRMYETNPNTQFPPNPTQHNPTPQNVTNSAPSAVTWEAIEDVALMSAWVYDVGTSLTKSSKAPTSAQQDVETTWLRSKRTKPSKPLALKIRKLTKSPAGALPPITGARPCPLAFSDRKSTRLNSSHITRSRMPSSA